MSQNFDPLAEHFARQREFQEAHVPPDARGADDEVANLEGLRIGGGVRVVTDYDVPAPPPSCIVRGGDRREHHADVREARP